MKQIHPDYLLPQLTSRQLSEWLAYFGDTPFGQDFSDYQVAQLTCMYFNSNRKKGEQAAKPEDFLPKKKQEQTPEQMMLALRRVIGGNR